MKLNQTSHKKPLWGALLAVVVIAIIAFLGRNFFGNIFASLSIHTKLHRLAKTEMLPLETTLYIDLLETENKNLRELLAVPKENTHALTARIVAWPSASLDGTFIIAAGAKDGVTIGNTVFLSHTIIGTITRVFPTRSIVSPIGATAQSVTFSGKEGVYKAELTGFGSYVIQVPKDVIIEPGETVAIPDYGPSVLGVVVSVDDKNSSSFTKVYVAHPASIYDARYVEVRILAPEVSQ